MFKLIVSYSSEKKKTNCWLFIHINVRTFFDKLLMLGLDAAT